MFRVYIFAFLFGFIVGHGETADQNSISLEENQRIYSTLIKYRSAAPYAVWDVNNYDHSFTPHHDAKSVLGYKSLEKLLSSPEALHTTNLFGMNKCIDPLKEAFGLKDKSWLLQLVDASGKLPPGMLKGAFNWVGNYDECIDITLPKTQNYTTDIRGLYCTVSLSAGAFPITTAICIPDVCEDFLEFFFALFSPLEELKVPVKINNFNCIKKDIEWSSAAIGSLFLLGVLLLFTFMGSLITAIDYYKEKEPSDSMQNANLLPSVNSSAITIPINEEKASQESSTVDNDKYVSQESAAVCNDEKELTVTHKEGGTIENKSSHKFISILLEFLKCFCIFTNGAKILNTETRPNQMNCLHGIRFLSMSWVILGHTFAFCLGVTNNMLDLINVVKSFCFQAILQGFFSVDSFFFLSGFLLTFLFLKEADKREGKINWILFYIHRIWRLTPTYMIVLGYYASVYSYMGSGPYWNIAMMVDNKNCAESWWHNLLYINNLFPSKVQCMGWSWYLANDMQFYLISPLFLYLLWKRRIIGLSIIGVLVLVSWISTGVLTAKYDLLPILSYFGKNGSNFDTAGFQLEQANSFDKIYVKPYTRIGPYLIGALVGYLLYITGDRKNFLTLWQQALGWIMAAFFCLSCVYGQYDTVMTLSTGATYNALTRTVWGLGLGWVVYACLTGHGGPVNDLLSWKFWIPLSRLTYCAYLIHPVIMFWYYQSLRTGIYFTYFTMTTYFLAFIIYSYMAALAVTLVAESPMMGIEKLVLQPKK